MKDNDTLKSITTDYAKTADSIRWLSDTSDALTASELLAFIEKYRDLFVLANYKDSTVN